MRISIVLPPSAPAPVGGYLVEYELADRLSAAGHLLSVVHPVSLDPPSWRQFPHWTIAVLGAPRGRRMVRWHSFHPRVRLRAVPWLAPQFLPRADITVLTAWQTATRVPCRTRRSGPLAQVVYDYEFWAGANRTTRAEIEKALRRRDVEHIATSSAVREMLDDIGVKARATVPPGLSDRFQCRTAPALRARIVGFPARWRPHKGLADVLPALERLHELYSDISIRCFGNHGTISCTHGLMTPVICRTTRFRSSTTNAPFLSYRAATKAGACKRPKPWPVVRPS
jgi:glycosyltransferase involved in cell wall biosynthesis